MNRKDFFKKLGAGAIVVAVAPKVLADIKPVASIAVDVSKVPDGMTITELMKDYRENGTLLYKDSLYAKAQAQADFDLMERMTSEFFGQTSTPLDTIIREARRKGYDFSEY